MPDKCGYEFAHMSWKKSAGPISMNLYQLAGFFFGEESLDAAVLGGIARLDCCDEVRFSFGGYMDQTIQFALFRKGDEHEILSPENRPKV